MHACIMYETYDYVESMVTVCAMDSRVQKSPGVRGGSYYHVWDECTLEYVVTAVATGSRVSKLPNVRGGSYTGGAPPSPKKNLLAPPLTL